MMSAIINDMPEKDALHPSPALFFPCYPLIALGGIIIVMGVGIEMTDNPEQWKWIQYEGAVWIGIREIPTGNIRDTNVRIGIRSSEEELVSIDWLRMDSDMIFYKKEKRLGNIDDKQFQEYIFKLTGSKRRITGTEDDTASIENELDARICNHYKMYNSIGRAAGELGKSKDTIRRTLITYGHYSNEKTESIRKLADGGHSANEIAEIVKISPNKVRTYLPYGYQFKSK